MVDAQQHIGLDKLCLNGRCTDRDNRLIGENGRTLGNRPDIAGKLEICEVGKEFLAEHIAAAEIVDILRSKVQILNILNNLLQTCRNGEAAAVGTFPEEQVKVGNAVTVACGKIALAHGQLIVVAEHGEIQFIVDNHCVVTSF